MASNPNTIPLSTTWAKEYQLVYDKMPVYPAITNNRMAPDIKKNDTVTRTYPRQFVANDMGGGGEFTRQVIVDTEETLTINKEKDTSFYIKTLDEIQSHLPTRSRYAQESVKALHRQIDADVLGEYASFANSLDASFNGGTATYGIEVTPQNVAKLFSSCDVLLNMANVYINIPMKFTGNKLNDAGKSMPVAVISPQVYAAITQRIEGKDTQQADAVGTNGFVGKYFNHNLFVSNALAWTGTLNMSVQPTDGDTVTIMGVTYTFKNTVDAGTTAGQIEIGSTVDVTRNTLTDAINDPATTVADGTVGRNAISATPDSSGFSNRDRMKNVVATNNNTTDKMSLVAKGKGYVPVSSSFTDPANKWDTNLQIQHCLIGVEGAIDLVLIQEPTVDERKRDGFVGYDIVTWIAYGIKTFNDGLGKLVDVKVLTANYSGDDGN